MSNYKITSADFVTPGESLEPDAYLSPEDKALLNSTRTGMSAFLRSNIDARLQQPVEAIPESTVTIIREQKYNG
jgi:hypothetical protein